MSRFMYGAYEEARQAAESATELLWSNFGQLFHYFHVLYRALTLAACYRDAPEARRREYLEAIQQDQRQLAEWAELCPENFRAAERLVSAELARLNGPPDKAFRTYEEALQAAREQGSLQNVGLVCELAARHWKEQGLTATATFFAREAREALWQWGAEGKARHLDEQWPSLTLPSKKEHTSSTSYDTDRNLLDALTVVKAQQAISSEIVLERLGDTLMRVALENAGAQRGALLLLRNDTLELATLADSPPGQTTRPGEAARQLPWTLLHYVRRSAEHVLIHNTSEPHPFSTDPYFSHSLARSVLCLPLGRQEELRGLLYLENDLATEAFSPSRIALLRHIAAQATISVENARLYAEVRRAETALRQSNDELEQRVEERTQELKRAQAHLVETARVVGMAEIASNILHEIGNTLNSILTDAETIRRTVDTSRLGRVRQVASLLEEHRDNLTHFVNSDPRGSHLLAYLFTLADELAQEQATVKRNLKTLSEHVGHVRSIVHSQRTYAKSLLLLEECELATLLEEALRLHSASLRQARISVLKELAPVPKVKVDRQRVLQILIHLLSNARTALEAVPEGARCLRVRLTAEEAWVHLQVVDNGEGLTPEVRGLLFTQGFSTRKNGYGIGLHSSALAAQLMGGRLTLESEGPGLGATATLALPIPGRGGSA